MANGRIIEAAQAAFTKPKIDISGYVGGLTAIAAGMIQRNKFLEERRKAVDQLEIDTNDDNFKAIFNDTKTKIYNGEIDFEDGVKQLKQMSDVANKVVPELRNQIEQLQLKGFSGFSDVSLENYITALQTGELNTPIKVDGKEIKTLFIPTEGGKVLMLGPDMTYQEPKLVLSKLQNITTKDQGSKSANLVSTYISQTYTDEDKWRNETNAMNTQLKNNFSTSDKAKYSFLFDYSFSFKDGEEINFVDYYLEKALFDANAVDEEGNNIYDQIEELPGDVNKRVKNMLVYELMKSDPDFDKDVDTFIKEITDSKKPNVDPNELTYDPTSQIGGIIGEVDDMFKSLKTYDPQNPVKIFNDAYSIVRITDERDIQAVKDKYGPNVNTSNFFTISGTDIIFDATTNEGIINGLTAFKRYQPKTAIGEYNKFLNYVKNNTDEYIAEPMNTDYSGGGGGEQKITLEPEQIVEFNTGRATYNIKKGEDGRFYVENFKGSKQFNPAGGKILRKIQEKYN
jgi:hypothetical protein